MTRLASLLVGGFFLLHPAASADQLRLYNFVDDYCNNQPTGGNLDIKKGACSNDIDSRSFKALINEKHFTWLDNVNKGKERCFLDTFEESNCPGDRIRDTLRLPDEIARCYTSNKAIRSVKFRCETVKNTIVTNNRTITDTVVVTSWSLNGNQPLSAITSTKTETHISQFTQAQPARVDANAISHGAAEPNPSDMERYPWLYHPWSGSPICYHCRRHSEDDHTNFECRSGPDYPINCGEIPLARNGDPLTSTISPTATVTVLVPGAAMGVAERQEIEPRASWHKRVSFEHPFIQGLWVCADAEWEKRGQPHNEIRLQGAKVFNDATKECKGRQSLDLPDPVVVGGLTTTITRAAPATIGMAASASAKVQKGHDDL